MKIQEFTEKELYYVGHDYSYRYSYNHNLSKIKDNGSC